MSNPWDGVASILGGKPDTAPKEINHIVTRKGTTASGKPVNVHTHVHKNPAHPDEEHVTEGNKGLADHMTKHLGEAKEDAPDTNAANAPAKPDATASQAIPTGGTGAASNSPTSATRNSGAATGGAVTITMSPSSTSTGTTTGAGAGASKGGNGNDKSGGKSEKPPQNVNITVDARGMSGHAAS